MRWKQSFTPFQSMDVQQARGLVNTPGDYLLIYNLGDGTGIFSRGGMTFGGRPAFWIKDWIDRRFMKRFQTLE